MRFISKLLSPILIFTILFPAPLFAGQESEIDRLLREKVAEKEKLDLIEKQKKEMLERLEKERIERLNIAKGRISQIESLPFNLKKETYESLATNLIKQVLEKNNNQSIYRAADEDSKISEGIDILEMISFKESETRGIELDISEKKTLREVTVIGSITIPLTILGVLFARDIWIYGKDDYYHSSTALLNNPKELTSFSSNFIHNNPHIPFAGIILGTVIAAIFAFACSSDMIWILSKSNRIKFEKKLKQSFLENHFWKKIYEAIPTLSKDPKKRTAELQEMLLVRNNVPLEKVRVLQNAVQKVEAALTSSSCENDLTVGTSNANAIEKGKAELNQIAQEREALAEQEAEAVANSSAAKLKR